MTSVSKSLESIFRDFGSCTCPIGGLKFKFYLNYLDVQTLVCKRNSRKDGAPRKLQVYSSNVIFGNTLCEGNY